MVARDAVNVVERLAPYVAHHRPYVDVDGDLMWERVEPTRYSRREWIRRGAS